MTEEKTLATEEVAEVTGAEEENDDYNETDELRKELEAERAKREKAEGRFKKTAKELNALKKSDDGNGLSDELIDKKINERMFYESNPTAKEYKAEIKEIQSSTGMSPEDAMTFYIAKNKPELIGKQASPGVDGISQDIKPTKAVSEMTYEELRPNK